MSLGLSKRLSKKNPPNRGIFLFIFVLIYSRMRNSTNRTTSRKSAVPEYKAPERPKFKNLSIASAYVVEPVIVDVHPSFDLENAGSIADVYRDENNFVVGVGRLRGNNLFEFQQTFGCDLNTHVMKIMAAIQYHSFSDLFNRPDFEEQRSYMEVHNSQLLTFIDRLREDNQYDPDTGVFTTRHGQLVGSLSGHMLRLAAFILTRLGRIVGDDGSSPPSFHYEPVDMDTILSLLTLDSLSATSDEGRTMFEELLALSGLYAFAPPEDASTEDEQEAQGEDQKNVP